MANVEHANIRDAIKKVVGPVKTKKQTSRRTTPLWTPADGITFSLLSKFIICRHRFWIRVVLGLREDLGFDHTIEYGNFLHAGFEEFSRTKTSVAIATRIKKAVQGIGHYRDKARQEHMGSEDDIDFWYGLAVAQFTKYATHWQRCDERRNYLFQERPFDTWTKLPSGRNIRMRGKYDEFFEEPKGRKTRLVNVLQENKSKGSIDAEAIMMALNADLQTMMYLHNLDLEGHKCLRIMYNVVLRPAGGKYPMRQKKSETRTDFQDRLISDVQKSPNKYFHRFPVDIEPEDLENFRYKSLFPYLEQLLDWWESIANNPMDPWNTYPDRAFMDKALSEHNPHHFVRPFGVFDNLALGTRGDYFKFVISHGQNRSGLKQLDTCFPELDDASLSAKRK